MPTETEAPDYAVQAEQFERVLEDVSLDDVDATAVLADEGRIDEGKVTDDTAILAASQASSIGGAQTMTDEEGNEETKEILGRVAALLAKYE
ncbi:MAG: hypothetical protein U5R31_13590 [Acidimicrobiia bacterium]|nr:hypothetical protein [Acidimicrobiia bacterium]